MLKLLAVLALLPVAALAQEESGRSRDVPPDVTVSSYKSGSTNLTVVSSSVQRVKSAIAVETDFGVYLLSEEDMTQGGGRITYRFERSKLIEEEVDGQYDRFDQSYDAEGVGASLTKRVKELVASGRKVTAAAELKARVSKIKMRIATLSGVASVGGGCERENSMTPEEAKAATERLYGIELIGSSTAADAAKSHKALSELEAAL